MFEYNRTGLLPPLGEHVSRLANEDPRNWPTTVCTVAASFAATVHDCLPIVDGTTEWSALIATALIGTRASLSCEQRRAMYCADWVLRDVAVPRLIALGHEEEAERLLSLDEISETEEAILPYGRMVSIVDGIWAGKLKCGEGSRAVLERVRDALSFAASVSRVPNELAYSRQTAYYAARAVVALGNLPSAGEGNEVRKSAMSLALRLTDLIPPEETRRRIAALPVSERCHEECRVWDVTNDSEVQACISCVSRMTKGQIVTDDDVALLPEAIAESKTVRASLAQSKKEDSSGTK